MAVSRPVLLSGEHRRPTQGDPGLLGQLQPQILGNRDHLVELTCQDMEPRLGNEAVSRDTSGHLGQVSFCWHLQINKKNVAGW